jgi:hypothetical protein
MALFHTDSIVLCCADVEAAKRWWIEMFDCQAAKPPADWDCPLPSDVALTLPGSAQPAILLCSRAEVERAGYSRPHEHPIVFCGKVKKAHEYLAGKGAAPGPIQDGGGTQFFEIRDPEGIAIEVCKEP